LTDIRFTINCGRVFSLPPTSFYPFKHLKNSLRTEFLPGEFRALLVATVFLRLRANTSQFERTMLETQKLSAAPWEVSPPAVHALKGHYVLEFLGLCQRRAETTLNWTK
jgi:hypothetical protein